MGPVGEVVAGLDDAGDVVAAGVEGEAEVGVGGVDGQAWERGVWRVVGAESEGVAQDVGDAAGGRVGERAGDCRVGEVGGVGEGEELPGGERGGRGVDAQLDDPAGDRAGAEVQGDGRGGPLDRGGGRPRLAGVDVFPLRVGHERGARDRAQRGGQPGVERRPQDALQAVGGGGQVGAAAGERARGGGQPEQPVAGVVRRRRVGGPGAPEQRGDGHPGGGRRGKDRAPEVDGAGAGDRATPAVAC